MAKRIIFLFLASLCAVFLRGQASPAQAHFVRATFGFVGAGTYKHLYYKTFTENPEDAPVYRPLNFSTGNLLGKNPYYGPPEFEVYWKSPKDGEYTLLERFAITHPSTPKSLIMWLENPREVKNGERPQLQFRAFDPSLKNYPYGTITVINFTKHPIAGKVAGEVLRNIGAEGVTTKIDGRTLPIDLYTYDAAREKIMPAYTANFATGRQSRFFVLLFPTERNFPFYMDARVISDTTQPTARERENIKFEMTD